MPRSARSRHAPVSQRDGRRSYVHHEIASSSRLTVTAISTFANNLVGILVKRRDYWSEEALRFESVTREARQDRRVRPVMEARSSDFVSVGNDGGTKTQARPRKSGRDLASRVFPVRNERVTWLAPLRAQHKAAPRLPRNASDESPARRDNESGMMTRAGALHGFEWLVAPSQVLTFSKRTRRMVIYDRSDSL